MSGPENELERFAELQADVAAGSKSVNQARAEAGLPEAPPSIVPDPPMAERLAALDALNDETTAADKARAAVAEHFGVTVGPYMSALTISPDQWLFINLGEHATEQDARESLAILREKLPPEVSNRIVIVAAEQIAVIET